MLGRSDVRPDPVLTPIAQEYGTGGGFAVEACVPRRGVPAFEFKYATWDLGKDLSDFTETLRAPGDGAKRDIDPTLAWSTGLVLSHGKKQSITDEDRTNAPNPAALERARIQRMVYSLRRAKEIAFRDFVTDTGTIANAAPGVKWDAANNVVIEANIDAAKELFLKACGFEATHILIPPAVAKVMKRDSTIRDLIKYTQDSLLINGDLPPTIFNLKVVIPGAIVNTANPGQASSIARLWAEDKVVLLYVNPQAANDPEAMTSVTEFGVDGYVGGSSYPTVSWRDPDPTTHTDWIAVENNWIMKVTAAAGVYILDDVLT